MCHKRCRSHQRFSPSCADVQRLKQGVSQSSIWAARMQYGGPFTSVALLTWCKHWRKSPILGCFHIMRPIEHSSSFLGMSRTHFFWSQSDPNWIHWIQTFPLVQCKINGIVRINDQSMLCFSSPFYFTNWRTVSQLYKTYQLNKK